MPPCSVGVDTHAAIHGYANTGPNAEEPAAPPADMAGGVCTSGEVSGRHHPGEHDLRTMDEPAHLDGSRRLQVSESRRDSLFAR